MARSPRYKRPHGMEGKSLAGIRHCGCVTAALAIRDADIDYAQTTEKDVRDFYADMATSGREVRWMDDEEIRAKLFQCTHDNRPEPSQ